MSKKNQNKTVATDHDVMSYFYSIEDQQKHDDSITLNKLFQKITKNDPIMWGNTIVGYSSYQYKYDSGREGDMCRTGFSARKNAITIYCMSGFSQQDDLLQQLGRYKLGKSCLYVKRLSDINMEILSLIIERDWDYMNKKYPQ